MADNNKFGKNGWKIRMASILTLLVIVLVLGGAAGVSITFVKPKFEAYQKAKAAEKEKEEKALAKKAAADQKKMEEEAAKAKNEETAEIYENENQEAAQQETSQNEGKTEFQEAITEETVITTEAEPDYIIPDSNSRYLSEADIRNMSIQQINYAKNEIYARHGRIFVSNELKNYFESKSWYQGTIDGATFDKNYKNYFNQYEITNTEFLSKIEFSMEDGGYKLDQ
ncbi:MAG: YARHG domain-containing protein [Blautia wexlerae]